MHFMSHGFANCTHFRLANSQQGQIFESKVYIYFSRHALKSQLNSIFQAGLDEFNAVVMGDTYRLPTSARNYVDDETVGHHLWVTERREWALKTMQNAIAD